MSTINPFKKLKPFGKHPAALSILISPPLMHTGKLYHAPVSLNLRETGAESSRTWNHRFSGLLLLNILCIIVSSYFSFDHNTAWLLSRRAFFLLLSAIFVGYLFPWTLERFKQLFTLITGAGSLAGAVALVLLFVGKIDLGFYGLDVFRENHLFRWPMVASVFNNPNSFGIFLVIAVASSALLITLVAQMRPPLAARSPEYALIALVGLKGLALFFTFSRASFLTQAVFALFFCRYNSSRAGSLFFVIQLILHMLICGTLMWNRADGWSFLELSRFLNGRDVLWAEGWQLFLSKPLFGHGLGGWAAATGRTLPVHNTYLQVAVELGLAGLLAYLGSTLYFLNSLVQGIKQAARHSPRYILLSGILALTLGLLVHQLFESHFIWGIPIFLLFLVVFYPFTTEQGSL